MKSLLKILTSAAVMLGLVWGFVSCKKEYEPKEIPFIEYSLDGSSCEWKNLNYDESVIVINSNEKLEEYIDCSDGAYPEIDFSKKSLLFVLVRNIAGCNIDSRVESLLLRQIFTNTYCFFVEIMPSETTNAAPFFQCIAVVTEKINKRSIVKLNVSTIKS